MKIHLAFIFSLFATVLFAEGIKGDWQGTLKVNGMELPLIFHFFEKNNALTGTMDSPMQGAKNCQLQMYILAKTLFLCLRRI